MTSKSWKAQREKISLNKKSTIDEEYDSVVLDVEPILLKNGWERKVGNLLSPETPVKESRVEGKEIKADSSYIRLLKLDAMGANIVSSILPDDIDL